MGWEMSNASYPLHYTCYNIENIETFPAENETIGQKIFDALTYELWWMPSWDNQIISRLWEGTGDIFP